MTDLEHRMAAVEARLQAAEDELAIIRLVASYGPLVDGGSTELAPGLFGTDGIYDLGTSRVTGAQGVAGLLQGSMHQDLLATGVAHVMGLPWVHVCGDQATAINSTQLFLRDGDGYSIYRVAQNLWKLQRNDDGRWTICERINRLIGPEGHARQLLEQAV